MIINKKIFLSIISIAVVVIVIILIVVYSINRSQEFDGQRAFDNVNFQVGMGPRTMGSQAHDLTSKWIISTLTNLNWTVETQETIVSGVSIKNIVAKRGSGVPWVILGSHYDSRSYADEDPNPKNRTLPVPGANDGASSTAVLIELARVVPQNLKKQVWLVFFDAEDNGNALGLGWDLGSNYFVSQLQGKPDSVVILDMIGDKDLNIYMERNSSPVLNEEIWGIAAKLGYTQFISKYKFNLIDDHTPFIRAGIRAADIIDFDYPSWHTISDTPDKISIVSLKAVGSTILKWLEQYP